MASPRKAKAFREVRMARRVAAVNAPIGWGARPPRLKRVALDTCPVPHIDAIVIEHIASGAGNNFALPPPKRHAA